MQRCGSGFLVTLVIIFVSSLTGCLGKSSPNSGGGGVQSVSLNPGGTLSINVGSTQVFTAAARDAHNVAIPGVDIQFIVESGSPNAPAPLSVTNNGSGSGSACAGTWDPTGTICSPGPPGIAYVKAFTNGFSSPRTEVFIHQPIDSIQIVQAEPQPPQYACFPQGQTWQFQGKAYSQGLEITNTVGPMSWSSSNPGVVNVNSTLSTLLPNQVQTTASIPGITQLFASASGTTSSPYPYTTCLIQAIYLQQGGQNDAGNSITVNNGASVSVTAIAVDTLCGVANDSVLTHPPLTWSTTNPDVAAFSTILNNTGANTATTRNNLGGATLTASCTPPTCNIGLPLSTASEDLPGLPVYASNYDATAPPTKCQPPIAKGFSAISVNVTSTTNVPTYTAWAATTDCNDAPGCSSALFSVTPGATPIGTIVGLPRTPNSMFFNHQSRLYIGSDQGLMYVDTAGTSPGATLVSTSPIPCNVSLCGKVLTISNDGKLVVVSDTVSTPSQVYIYNGGTTPVDLVIPGETATAAAFSPDQLKLFILTSAGHMYVYSTVDAVNRVSLAAPATDVAFSADGSFAYVAGTPANSVSAYSTCSLPNVASQDIGSVTTSGMPLKIFPSPALPPPVAQDGFLTTQKILALEPPNIQTLTAQFTQNPIVQLLGEPLQLTCNPPLLEQFTAAPPVNLGQGSFIPIYSQLVADGNELVIVGRHIPAVLLFNVTNGTTTSVPLVNNPSSPDPLSAAGSTDGSQVYIAACDAYPNNDPTQPCTAASVHIVNTVNGGDVQRVPYININDNNNPNMCNNQGGSAPLCLPNLIAIKPQ